MKVAFLNYSSSTAIPAFFSPSPLLQRRLGLGFRESAMAAMSGNRDPDLLLESATPLTQKQQDQKKDDEGEEAKKKKEEDELGEPPEKPLPGDCCGSGCVRCVWDMYFEELDLYNSRKAALDACRTPR
eukprot:c8080_g1_i1 orf=29-412(+)